MNEHQNRSPIILEKILSQVYFSLSKILVLVMKSIKKFESNILNDLKISLNIQLQRNDLNVTKNLLLSILLISSSNEKFKNISVIMKTLKSKILKASFFFLTFKSI